ncbi:surfactin synthase thioesterase subunit [Mucilaginibacter sp. SG538B]|uniref:thioesterase II family protein n=1 Tax=Mucilaginibacter sp. SG538B TaxID=2587021 RepID=UPI00159DBE02|nr:thioesterase [Mucilaginibacter sp. SG538B]NVM66962.1 surfactin synthase thioesterase subunit [Mucilaginibacter sp. SG538B]
MIKPQIFLLHYAGGNQYSYQFLFPYLTPDFEIVTLELPGRGKRIHESLILDFNSAVDDIYKFISPKFTSGTDMIMGHSLGALLGFFVTEKLEANQIFPRSLIVSGNSGPSDNISEKRYDLPSIEFKSMLQNLGGMPDGFFEEDDLFEFYEPILRADFKLSETIKNETGYRIRTPVTAIMGSEEPTVNKINNWRNYTKGPFNAHVLKGGHFFIHQNAYALGEIIRSLR